MLSLYLFKAHIFCVKYLKGNANIHNYIYSFTFELKNVIFNKKNDNIYLMLD